MLFILVFLLLLFGITKACSVFVSQRNFEQSNTESNLLILDKPKHYDYLFLGNSHARNFSRHGNHQVMEDLFKKTILNLGQGSGLCGPNDLDFYLSYVLDKGYSFDKIFITLSPPFLYGEHLNHSTNTFYAEPFQLDFFLSYLSHEAPNKSRRLLHYLRSKWSPTWWKREPASPSRKVEVLKQLDSTIVKNGFDSAYPKGREELNYKINAKHLERMIGRARQRGIEVILMSTPVLFGQWPGQERLNKYCDSLALQQDVHFENLVSNIHAPEMYYDHHHLNSDGIELLLDSLHAKGY